MGSVVLGTVMGLVLAAPQLWRSYHYAKKSIRKAHGWKEKCTIGNISLTSLLTGFLFPRRATQIDGVLFPEVATYIGLVPIFVACFAPLSVWHWVALFSLLMAMGNRTPLFRLLSPLCLRIPARFVWAFSFSLVMLAVQGFPRCPIRPEILIGLTIFDLALYCSWTVPMKLWTQPIQRPSDTLTEPIIQLIKAHPAHHRYRVSGLPYPHRPGLLAGIRTLGYNGGSQLAWMAKFRGDSNPMGSGAHDWFSLNEDGEKLDWYGVKWAYSRTPLSGKWRPLKIPHWYENTQACYAPSWVQVEHG